MSSDNNEILRCTVMSEWDRILNLFSASLPIIKRFISFAHGIMNFSAIVWGTFALAIRQDTRKDTRTAASLCCLTIPEESIRDCYKRLTLLSKYDRPLLLQSGWLVSKCLLSFDGFMDSDDRTFSQSTHCGFSSPFPTIHVNPNRRYDSKYVRFLGTESQL